jgi:hypothetical protein
MTCGIVTAVLIDDEDLTVSLSVRSEIVWDEYSGFASLNPYFMYKYYTKCPSQWPRGLRHEQSSPA